MREKVEISKFMSHSIFSSKSTKILLLYKKMLEEVKNVAVRARNASTFDFFLSFSLYVHISEDQTPNMSST